MRLATSARAHGDGEMLAQFLVIGRRITFERYPEHDWEAGLEDLSSISWTRGGIPDIAPGQLLRTLNFTMKWVSEAEYFEKVAPLDQAAAQGRPVYLCFNPAPTSRRMDLTFFGLLEKSPTNKRWNARAFERRYQIRSFI